MQYSDRDYTCPKCGGWMEGYEDSDDPFVCDTCDEELDESELESADEMDARQFRH